MILNISVQHLPGEAARIVINGEPYLLGFYSSWPEAVAGLIKEKAGNLVCNFTLTVTSQPNQPGQ